MSEIYGSLLQGSVRIYGRGFERSVERPPYSVPFKVEGLWFLVQGSPTLLDTYIGDALL